MSESIWNDPRITAYVLGDLPEDQVAEFEQAMRENPELASAVDEARGVTGQLQNLYASEPDATLDEQRREAIASQTPIVTPSPTESRRWSIPMLAMATAAALLLLVGVAPWLQRQQTETTVSQAETKAIGEVSEIPPSANKRQLSRSDGQQLLLEEELRIETESEESFAESLEAERLDRDFEILAEPSSPVVSGRKLAEVGLVASDSDAKLSNATQAQPVTATPSPATPSPVLRSAPAATPFAVDAPADATLGLSEPSSELMRQVQKKRNEAPAEVEAKLRYFNESESRSAVPAPTNNPSEARPEGISSLQAAAAPAAAAEVDDFERSSGSVRRILSVNGRGIELKEESRGRFAIGDEVSEGEVITLSALSKRSDRLESKLQQESEFSLPIDEGRGPGISGDRFEPITDNAFRRVSEHPLSTFSVDVDTASYSKTRDFLMRANQLPRPDAVRIEEMLNYFDYDYQPPSDGDEHPFAARAVVTGCPWNENHRLARIALKGKTMQKEDRPPCNLVFLLDTSGSMNAPNKLPLVIEGMQMLLKELDKDDQVAITVYAGSAGLVLDSTPVKKEKKIRKALTQLAAGGSTNGGAGIALAYQTAREHFLDEGVNRVILCTDGDFNVGTTGTDELVRMVEQEAKGGVFLSVLGFGMGNHNDSMLEQVSGRGNGNYAFIDSQLEAHKVLVEQTSATLVTIAKDVKLQIEFNPTHVSAYRLIGYENRVLAKEDFNDDKKDAGEIGAGHSVTALYEIVPAGVEADAAQPKVDDLKYQSELKPTDEADSNELMTLKLRYKQPDGDTSTLVEFPVVDDDTQFEQADVDVRFAAAVASFGMQLRRSEYAGSWTMSDVLKTAQQSLGEDRAGLRGEFIRLVHKASELMGEQ